MTTYDLIATLLRPVAWWGRLRVEGLDAAPADGPLLVVANHDSQWDPVLVGLALRPRRRLRFLARVSLWRIPGLGPLLDTLGQIPIRRGEGDTAALDHAVEALRSGEAVCVFPEGGLSLGEPQRGRSGAGRLIQACPGTRVALCCVEGTTDYVRFPRRPAVEVRLFVPENGDPRPDETPAEVATRLLNQIRTRVPPTPAGRRARVGGPPRVRRARARKASRS
ncbi:MAG TPA: lysophospholipid acyltransferase family protein [Solirubrobacterales bacterium]